MSSSPLRPAARSDAAAIVELVAALELALLGRADYSLDELEREWEGFDVEHDAWVAVEADRVVGYGTVELRHDHGVADGYVHPDAWGRGIGTELARFLETELGRRGAPLVRNGVLLADERAQELLRGEGYEEIRRFRRMRIELEREPVPPAWPDGLTVTSFDPDDAPRFHAALEEAFADHWSNEPEPYERFRRAFVDRPDFTPQLWTVVRAGDEIVAGTICQPERMGVGWIARLFTRSPWRRQGIGAALLADAFGRFWRAGQRGVGLGVDAQSDTGAHRLYERSGMHVHWGAVVFEKALT